jgi:hypothetical protein
VQLVTGTASPSGNATVTVTATCPAGKVVISGGFLVNAPLNGTQEPPFITQNQATSATQWSVTATKGSITRNFTVQATAVCISA